MFTLLRIESSLGRFGFSSSTQAETINFKKSHRRNPNGIAIDFRGSQIDALTLWRRAQRAYQAMDFKADRPIIAQTNIVCAEPMH